MTIPEEIAELEKQLQSTTDLKEQAEVILLILEKYASINSLDISPNIERLLVLAEELNSREYKAWVHLYKGIYFHVLSDLQTAIEEMEKSKELFLFLNHQIGMARYYHVIGNIHNSKGDYPKALSDYLSSLEIKEKIKDKTGIANSLHSIGYVYWYMGNHIEAISKHLESLSIREEIEDKLGIAASYHGLGNVYESQNNYAEAIHYHTESLKMKELFENKSGIASSYTCLGNIYSGQDKNEDALSMYLAALRIREEIKDKLGIATVNSCIGSVYAKQGNFTEALSKQLASLEVVVQSDNKMLAAQIHLLIGDTYLSLNEYVHASEYLTRGLQIAEAVGVKELIKYTLYVLYKLKKKEGDYAAALDYIERHIEAEKEFNSGVINQRIANIQMSRQKELQEKEVEIERLRNVELRREKERSEELLHNILPKEIADELKKHGASEARLYDEVTVMFTDFKNFTIFSERLSAKELVAELNVCFKAFDDIITKYRIEKIKTMGDGFIAAAGLPVPTATHAENMVQAAIEIRDFMLNRRKELGDKTFEVRIGLHSGKVVAGIVGVKKFAYDIWGDTVNTASRMEQHCEEGKVNISKTTYELVKDKYVCTHRGKIAAKNKGEVDMYYVE